MALRLLVALGLWLAVGTLGYVQAQELNCVVTINSQAAEGVDKAIFDDMRRTILEFMSQRKFTNDEYKQDERIKCALSVTIKRAVSNTQFEATVQITSTRPVYGSNYESIMLNYLDNDFNFDYVQGMPVDYNENAYLNNFTSLLSFYANIIVGLDMDTFGKLGGRAAYARAQNILNNAANGGQKGWNSMDGPLTRYWILENLQSQQQLPYREGLYTYHRRGLDLMSSDPVKGREGMLQMLQKMATVIAEKPINLMINNFMDAKSQEIIEIFKEADAAQRSKAYPLLVRLNPTRSDRYAVLK